MKELFTPFELSGLELPNRIVMPPMTRVRAPQDIATEQMALYYTQRATAGLIIAEGSPISNEGQGYLFNPGIYTPEQVAGWRLVTDSVKSVGGRIFLQLWHVGRISHTSIQENGRQPVSSTNRVARSSNAFGWDDNGQPGFVQSSVPRALATAEIKRITGDFVQAAKNAMEAGFDGIELHAANGYLFDQFLNPMINDRTDQYSAITLENRLRFLLETVDAVSAAIGPERVGVRLSPYGTLNDCPHFDDIEDTYLAAGKALGDRRTAYIHVMDQSGFFTMPDGAEPTSEAIRRLLIQWRKDSPALALIFDGSLTTSKAVEMIRDGVIDLAGFGQPFIANPDLVRRIREDQPLNVANRKTYYTGGASGYIDYPPVSLTSAQKALTLSYESA
ncbi:alkene reductase [Mucilaginibacter jinjuensis]|uniref:Alkene reductase n=1 Tax=Mucilaginibacter jinjuensis TaxID=1176721 RepID=A0ABY7TD91_9SPHI|nr:alkene reductase [Mucilaginibacter jinjuensis]WCT14328.1 alkene reductase [Mucilaginibacter jinjuensis]